MYTEYSSKYRVIGFGRTQEEAKEELSFNIARQNINNAESLEYARRRDLLYSWLPLPNILTIKGITSVIYEDGFISNSVTSEMMYIQPKRMAHYLYLFNLLGRSVSFEDFTISIGKEVDEFLANISPIFGNLDDFPYIKPGKMEDVISVRNYPYKCFVCDTKHADEVLVCGGNQLLSLTVPEGVDKDCIIAYGFAKLNILYDGRRLEPCQRDQKDSLK